MHFTSMARSQSSHPQVHGYESMDRYLRMRIRILFFHDLADTDTDGDQSMATLLVVCHEFVKVNAFLSDATIHRILRRSVGQWGQT